MSLSLKSERLIAGMLIAGFVALSVGYSAGPLFEGPDEVAHYRFIHDILSLGPLPDRGPDPEWDTYEYYQPPLYYLLQAPLRLVAPDPDFAHYGDFSTDFNGGLIDPHVETSTQVVSLVAGENVNFWVHTPDEAFPYTRSGTALAVHLMRLLSVALGTGAVIACYGVFHALWPHRPDRRLAALGLVAFWPAVEYSAAVINNDVLFMLTASLAVWLLLRMMRDGPTWKGAGILGGVLGLALLSKPSALILAAPVGLAVLLDWRRWWRYSILILGMTIAIGGWWYGYHAIVYHDVTGLDTLTFVAASEPIGSDGLPQAMIPSRIAVMYLRLWARFGGAGVIAPGWPIDAAFDLLTLAGLSGATVMLVRKVRRTGWRSFFASTTVRQGLVLAVFGLGLLAGETYRQFIAWHGNQGRHLLPAIASLAAALAFGLDAWTPPRLRLRLSLSLASGMAAIALLCLFGVFWPAYRLLPAPAVVEQPLGLRYGSTLQLLGSDRQTITARPGDRVNLNLYWRALASTPEHISVDLHTSGMSLFAVVAPPARGLLLPSQWLPGQTWSERYGLWIDDQAKPGLYRVYVLIVNLSTHTVLPITDAAGSPVLGPVAAQIVVR